MLMVPSLVPVTLGVGVVVAAVAGALAAPAGAAPPVWAHAEIVNPKINEKTAMARTDRRNLLVIGSLLTPWNCSGKLGAGNELRLPFSGNAGRTQRGLRLAFLLTTAVRRHLETRRAGLPASHAGVADVPSTP